VDYLVTNNGSSVCSLYRYVGNELRQILSPRGRDPKRGKARDVKSWARSANKLLVASGRLGRSGLHRGFLRGMLVRVFSLHLSKIKSVSPQTIH
jgi:hypothetical protein